MEENRESKPYDLEERTIKYARDIFAFTTSYVKNAVNTEITKQIIRSAGSVGANYIEAKESLGKKDQAMRIRICRKEVKETRYWLELLDINNQEYEKQRQSLIGESSELLKIFTAIIEKIK